MGLMAWLAFAQQASRPAVTRDALINAAGNGTEWWCAAISLRMMPSSRISSVV
jgi:hypothetical protein